MFLKPVIPRDIDLLRPLIACIIAHKHFEFRDVCKIKIGSGHLSELNESVFISIERILRARFMVGFYLIDKIISAFLENNSTISP